jgi:hypothetical protein
MIVYSLSILEKETVKSGTRGITPKTCSSTSGEVLRSFVKSFLRPHIAHSSSAKPKDGRPIKKQ